MVKVGVGPTGATCRYAWKILQQGVCDGCALGVAGFHDWTIDGVHLCMTRLKLLETNTPTPSIPPCWPTSSPLARAERRRAARPRPPRLPDAPAAGRARASRRIAWDEALGAVADAIRAAGRRPHGDLPHQPGLTNESYYVAGKAARAMGVANVDSAARVCHAPSTLGLKDTIGVAASHLLARRT